MEETRQAYQFNGSISLCKVWRRDPALFTLEDFQQAKTDPKFYDAQGTLKFAPVSQLRCIMQYAALQIADSPLNQRHFQFTDGDEWTTTGLKNIGGKKEDYLQEKELVAYVNSIDEIDTLVLHRLSLEGGGRICSQLLMGTTLPDGYRCQAIWDSNALTMMEPKVEGSQNRRQSQKILYTRDNGIFQTLCRRQKNHWCMV